MRLNFDPPETGWTLSGAQILAEPSAPTQPNCLRLQSDGGFALRTLSNPSLVAGQLYPFFVRVNFDGDPTDSGFLSVRYNFSAIKTVRPPTDENGDRIFVGWELRDLGLFSYVLANRELRFVHQFGSGHIDVDEILIGESPPEPVGFAMAKPFEIRESIVARCANVLVGNGYALSIAEATSESLLVPESVGNYPHVSVLYGEVNKELKTLTAMGRKACTATYQIDVYCVKTSTTDPVEQCENASGEIEKSLEEHDGSHFVGFPVYVHNVFVHHLKPFELPSTISRDIRRWSMQVDITYNHERGNP
jgi:hypothetical protein